MSTCHADKSFRKKKKFLSDNSKSCTLSDRGPHLNSLRQLKGDVRVFPESAGSLLPSTQNNPCAKVAQFTFWGGVFCSPLLCSSFPNHGGLGGVRDRVSVSGPGEGHHLIQQTSTWGLRQKGKRELAAFRKRVVLRLDTQVTKRTWANVTVWLELYCFCCPSEDSSGGAFCPKSTPMTEMSLTFPSAQLNLG